MNKLLIITTSNDLSLPLFFLNKDENLAIEVLLFEDSIEKFKIIETKVAEFDYVYFRDPFNTPLAKSWEEKTESVLGLVKKLSIKSIDNIYEIKDFFIEDKWQQYLLFKDFMPATEILSSHSSFNPNQQFVKKRISSRSKDILFEIDSIQNHEEYIIQEKLDIEEEYRVFSLFKKIISPAVYKSSKTINTKVKIDRSKTKEIDKKLETFINQVLELVNLDFVGFDIALTKSGQYKLIEANRSPQFKAFFETTKKNIVANFPFIR